MAVIRGKFGPPGNHRAFRHGLADISQQQIGAAERILAEIISSDVVLLVTFNQAIDSV